MTPFTTPTRRDPIARLTLIGCAAMVVWAGFTSATAPPPSADAAPADIILIATPALPTPAPTDAPALMLAAPTPEPQVVYVEVPAPAPAPEVVYVEVQAQTTPDVAPQFAAPAPDMQYGTDAFNHALVEARQELPTLNCPCGIDTTPANAPTARDYAYSKARTR